MSHRHGIETYAKFPCPRHLASALNLLLLCFAATTQDAHAQSRSAVDNVSAAESSPVGSVAAEVARDTRLWAARAGRGLHAVEMGVPFGDTATLVAGDCVWPDSPPGLVGKCYRGRMEGRFHRSRWFVSGGFASTIERTFRIWTMDLTAKAGFDYTANAESLTIRVGATSTPFFEIPITQDAIDEDDEYFVVRWESNYRLTDHYAFHSRRAGDGKHRRVVVVEDRARRRGAEATITGVDDEGAMPGTAVGVAVPAGSSRKLTSAELESGEADAIDSGALGDGDGKWRLRVASDRPILVVSLLENPTGHLTNLSTAPGRSANPEQASALPSAEHLE